METGWIRRDDPRWGPPPEDYDEDRFPVQSDVDVSVVGRVAALGRFTRLVSRYVSPQDAPELLAARELVERADGRLAAGAHSPRDRIGGHTVVALAGSTGVGKSSLFNALARMELSPAGHLRPTTGEVHACVWDQTGSDAILTWLGVPPHRRFMRESVLDADDEAALRGLVLLDLPDMDSIATGNRVEADRLVRVVDRVVWVLDPQKYADAAVHEQYLQRMGALRDVTVVVFNQCDRLSPDDAARCRADLARLVAADGLAGVPVIGTSTATGDGVGELRELLEQVVADRRAAAARIEAEVAASAAQLTALAPAPGPSEDEVSATAVPSLGADLADACGVEAIAADAAVTYRSRAVLWRAPWRVDRLPSIPAADPAAVSAALRDLAARVGRLLPEPWPRHLRAAATARQDRLADDLGTALTRARGSASVPPLWRVLGGAWWLSLGLAVCVLSASLVDSSRWLSVALSAAGLAVALPVLALATGAWRARRYRRAVERRLRLAVLEVAREVVAPVRAVLRDYNHAHDDLAEASRAGDSTRADAHASDSSRSGTLTPARASAPPPPARASAPPPPARASI